MTPSCRRLQPDNRWNMRNKAASNPAVPPCLRGYAVLSFVALAVCSCSDRQRDAFTLPPRPGSAIARVPQPVAPFAEPTDRMSTQIDSEHCAEEVTILDVFAANVLAKCVQSADASQTTERLCPGACYPCRVGASDINVVHARSGPSGRGVQRHLEESLAQLLLSRGAGGIWQSVWCRPITPSCMFLRQREMRPDSQSTV